MANCRQHPGQHLLLCSCVQVTSRAATPAWPHIQPTTRAKYSTERPAQHSVTTARRHNSPPMFRHMTSATAVVLSRSFCRHLLTRPSPVPAPPPPATRAPPAPPAWLPRAAAAPPCCSAEAAGGTSSCRGSQKNVNSCGGGRPPLPATDSASVACDVEKNAMICGQRGRQLRHVQLQAPIQSMWAGSKASPCSASS